MSDFHGTLTAEQKSRLTELRRFRDAAEEAFESARLAVTQECNAIGCASSPYVIRERVEVRKRDGDWIAAEVYGVSIDTYGATGFSLEIGVFYVRENGDLGAAPYGVCSPDDIRKAGGAR